MGEIDVLAVNAAVGLEHIQQLERGLFALVGADVDRAEALLAVIGMILLQQGVLFVGGHATGLVGDVGLASSLDLLHGLKHFLSENHGSAPPYFSMSRLL